MSHVQSEVADRCPRIGLHPMQETVFSGIRPAIKQALNRVYGIEPAQQQPQQQQGSSSSTGAQQR